MFFYRFPPCKRVRKHAFAGRNTQHLVSIQIEKYERWLVEGGYGLASSFTSAHKMVTGVVLKHILEMTCGPRRSGWEPLY